MISLARSLTAAVLVLGSGGCFLRTVQAPAPAASRVRSRADSLASADSARGSSGIKPYDSVITREAKTRRGLFVTHRVGEKLYFEIPRKELNRELLLVGRLARSAS